LLPEEENAIQIQQYRLICLLNISFKLFTKVRISDLPEVEKCLKKKGCSMLWVGGYLPRIEDRD
jgi:hypothetical protein